MSTSYFCLLWSTFPIQILGKLCVKMRAKKSRILQELFKTKSNIEEGFIWRGKTRICKNLYILDWRKGHHGHLLHPQLWLGLSPSLASGLVIWYKYIYQRQIWWYLIIKQVRMKLYEEDSDGLQLVPGSQGMNVPSACSIVIIAGFRLIHTQTGILG